MEIALHRRYMFFKVGYFLIQGLYCKISLLQSLFQSLHLLVVQGACFLGLIVFKLYEKMYMCATVQVHVCNSTGTCVQQYRYMCVKVQYYCPTLSSSAVMIVETCRRIAVELGQRSSQEKYIYYYEMGEPLGE